MDAAAGIPVAVVDAQDEPQSYLRSVTDFLGGPPLTVYFKREFLACHEYGPLARPFPFAYPDAQIPESVDGPRNAPVFWAGQRGFGLRRLYLEAVEKRFGDPFDAHYTPDQYARAVRDSQIGLCFFGYGFDTVRFWELPAHGCMLLAERTPLAIPHNFVDQESAVFFDDTESLLAKLERYRDDPDAACAIARAGHAHLRRYHTTSARARQLLDQVAASLP